MLPFDRFFPFSPLKESTLYPFFLRLTSNLLTYDGTWTFIPRDPSMFFFFRDKRTFSSPPDASSSLEIALNLVGSALLAVYRSGQDLPSILLPPLRKN